MKLPPDYVIRLWNHHYIMKLLIGYEVTGRLWSYHYIMKLPADYEVTIISWSYRQIGFRKKSSSIRIHEFDLNQIQFRLLILWSKDLIWIKKIWSDRMWIKLNHSTYKSKFDLIRFQINLYLISFFF